MGENKWFFKVIYIFSLAVYLMTILTLIFNIIIGREIGATSHGKDVVDGLNSRDKIYLRKQMNRLLNILPQLLKALVCFPLNPLCHMLAF